MKSVLRKRVTPHFFSVSGFISGLVVLLIFTAEPAMKMHSSRSLLCLGDSYTIGESVPVAENFPNQVVRSLRESGFGFQQPEILAKTGWTTDELQQAINQHRFQPSYDFVTLLIGVNNQYRGENVEHYKPQFESLLEQAIQFAKGDAAHVIVLSIPDWGTTPFAKDRNTASIAREIDDYNKVNKEIAAAHKAHYIDITTGMRETANDLSLLASDGLHPSAKEYARWSREIYEVIKREIE